ncbi:helix-turn-helix transcriptional regulator [Dactylosporangium aurantiacum]|uniref:Helix-turn-helix transcriptional regulator n=1 Tax=Dactylosporangium aurantiacum TaxID=35754 RepID=A0A9Q9MPP1_9ACTN|nr:helix-turn-helix transcriptional regulator [Dactylosporangium aurantiacum]MDG6104196.1 helix-turn-helix transcriptional regulator [Dactylosporangium aurantiacum]UWZ56802.1 helix-turn-helix transcriptional regulator [Dactylosporangium aurantiacum]
MEPSATADAADAAALRAAVGTGAVAVVTAAPRVVHAALDGVAGVGWTHCPPDTDAPPLWPLTRLLPAAGVPGSGFAGAVALAEALAAAHRTVVVEDVQHASAETLAVLRHLGRTAASAGVLLVVTYDGAGGRHPAPLAETLRVLAGVRGAVPLGPVARIGALLASAGAEVLAGRPRAAAALCVEAADLATACDRADLLAEAALVLPGAGDPDVVARLVLLCDRALTRFPPGAPAAGGAAVLRARLLARRAGLRAEGDQGDPADGVAALAAAEAGGDPGALLDAARARMWHLDRAGDTDERLRLADLTVATALRCGQLRPAVRGELWRIDVRYQQQDLRGVDDGITRLHDLADAARAPVAAWHARRADAARAALAGRFTAARAASAEAHRIAGTLGDDLAMVVTDVFAGLLALVRGDPRELRDGWEERLGAYPGLPIAVAAAALAWHQAGHRDEALARYERLRHLLREPPRGVRWLGVLQHLTELALLLQDAEAAAWALPLWRPWAGSGGFPGNADSFCGGAADRTIGRLAALLGRHEEAVAALERAVRGNTRLDARPWLVHTWLDLATLRSAGGAGTGGLAGRAAAEARRLDMPGAVRAAAALLDDPLTAREREIAALVAAALSNRDIAARLVVSERTVETHVRHILAKLGLPNRTALTAFLLSGSR